MTARLAGQVALVAGATRGAGRGIARELAAAGAKVYCTGRSTTGRPATPGRPETIDETVQLIVEAGGEATAIRVDHTVEAEVEALAVRVREEAGRLDVLVNDIWGGDALIDWGAKFWTLDITAVRTLVERSVLSHVITSRYLAPLMVEAGRGLIVEITDGELAGYRGQLLHDLVKASVIRLAYAMAWDLVGTGVTALVVSPGFLRSEAMLDGFGVSEENWRDAIAKEAPFAFSETPRLIGRVIAALAADPNVGEKSGGAYWTSELAEQYGLTDVDGRLAHFWRTLEAEIEEKLSAPGDLDAQMRWLAEARYMHVHLTPARADQARRLAARLDWDKLGEGLRPIALPPAT